MLVADEPVSALDLLVQAQILNLLAELRKERNLAIVLITHDLTVVEHIADRVAVMYLGRIVETGPVAAVTRAPAHPYTRALLASAPRLRLERNSATPLRGELPSPLDPPPGCHFNPRCPLVVERCLRESPVLAPTGDRQLAACHVTAPAVHAEGERMSTADVNGISIHYELEGDGPETVVLVNGLADELESWGYQTPRCSRPASAS